MFKRLFSWIGKVFRRSASGWIYRQPHAHTLFPNSSGATITEDTAISWTAIWRGLNIIGSAVGSMPFTIIEEDNRGNIKTRRDHPLWRMINIEPHPYYSTFDFLKALMFQAILRGNGIAVMSRTGVNAGRNRPATLRLVSWDDVYDVKEVDDHLFYMIKGYDEPVSYLDVIHIKGLTKDGILGLDTLQWNRETFGLSLSSKRSAAAYHKSGVHSDGFLSTEQQLDPETVQHVEQGWIDKNQAGETPLLTGGVTWQKTGITPKDLQLLEVRQFNVYEAARLIGLSPHLLFAMDRANFSNIETLSLEFAKYTLRFWAEIIEQEFNRKVFRRSEQGRVKVSLNMDAFLRGDTEARANYLKTLLDRAVITIDEARKIEGFNAYPDGKGDVALAPQNFQTLEQMIDGDPEDEDAKKAASERLSFDTMKAKLDAYGVGVRAGAFTPQKSDEDLLRDEAGLPIAGDDVSRAWEEDDGIRRPITLKLKQELNILDQEVDDDEANDDESDSDEEHETSGRNHLNGTKKTIQ